MDEKKEQDLVILTSEIKEFLVKKTGVVLI
jgi:hypothetical protein